MAEMVRELPVALVAVEMARAEALTETVLVRAVVSAAHRLARTIRTATAIMDREAADRVALAVVREARAASAAVRVEQVASTVAARADREASDLAPVEWAVPLQFLQ